MNNNIEKPITADYPDQDKSNFTLKILFGPMFGCDLHLTAEDYFFIINSNNSLLPVDSEPSLQQAHSTHYTYNTLYIPCNYPAPNVLLRLSSLFRNDKGSVVSIEVYSLSETYITEIHENEVFIHDNIRFAFKHSQEKWSDKITDYHSPNTNLDKLSPAGYPRTSKKNLRRIIFSTLGILITSSLLIFFYFYNHTDNNENHMAMLNKILSNSLTPVSVVKSRDNKFIFVLVSQKHEMEWIKKTLLKTDGNSNVIPLWTAQQQKSIVSQLVQSGHPVLQLDFSSPMHPVIAVHQKLKKNEEVSLKSVVLEKIPYAVDIEVLFKSKENLLTEARNALDSLNIQYRQLEGGGGYSLVIRDTLSDLILHRLSDFIENFQLKWGNKVINFSINQDENWLLNKSYIDSDDGYLFLTPRHWYIPLNLGEINRERYK